MALQKILVTGATGFIGNYVIKELLKKECKIVATSLDPEKAATFSWFDKVTYIPFNIRLANQHTNYVDYFDRPDIVIHLAWEGLPNYKDEFHLSENYPAHYLFLKNLIENKIKNLSITGTCFEYGMQEGSLLESMDVFPDNAYGIAKNRLRLDLEKLQTTFDFSFKWLRLFYLYGQGQNPKSLLSQLNAALDRNDDVFNMSGGDQVRDFLPIERVAEYIVKTSLQTKINGIINCSSNKPITVKQLVMEFLREKDKKITLNLGFYPYTDYEPFRFWGNNEKLLSI